MAASNPACVAVLCLSWLHHVGWHCAVPGVRSREHSRHIERRPYLAFFQNTVRPINRALVFYTLWLCGSTTVNFVDILCYTEKKCGVSIILVIPLMFLDYGSIRLPCHGG